MKNKFSRFMAFREQNETKPNNTVMSKVRLSKDSDYMPFNVSKGNRANLRILMKSFDNSDKTGIGYTTIEKSKGEVEPTLKRKALYLSGGSVRDHLKNKTQKNYNLVTDATASEIRMILKHAENSFIEIKPKNESKASSDKYAKLLKESNRNKYFYASRWDKGGKESEFTIVINGEKFELSTMSKSSKSKLVDLDSFEATGSLEDDASNRDFTINSMYIPLTNSDGDNSDLIDPYGGAHHLKNSQIVSVNDDFKSRIEEDPGTAMRYARMLSKYGNPDDVAKKYSSAIKGSERMGDLSKDYAKKEFFGSIEDPDIDSRKYLRLMDSLGLLRNIMPDYSLEDMPTSMKGDRWLTTAWLTKDKDSEELKDMLVGNGWSKQEAGDIAHLVSLYKWSKSNFDPSMFYDLKSTKTGLTKGKIKDWMKMGRFDGPQMGSFLSHDDSDLSPYVDTVFGKKVNPAYVDMLGHSPKGDDFERTKRHLSTKRFLDNINS